MSYIENPKTKDSGLICCIPQSGTCPVGCADCFFQSGRSYLEPLEENVPNMPPLADTVGRVVRVNDGNDSHNDQAAVIAACAGYADKFYNTSVAKDLAAYDAPVILTLNPAAMTDTSWHRVEDEASLDQLMAVRFRLNTWNLHLALEAVDYYEPLDIALFMTFMRYHEKDSVPSDQRHSYEYATATLNPYWKMEIPTVRRMIKVFDQHPRVYICGENGRTLCKNCGNCLREYNRWKEAHA